MTSLVSVIIPAFNASAYIADTLTSVSNQTWKNLEVVVVDDGSTDKTAQVVRAFKHNRLSFIQQQHAGACAARNNGLRHSSGAFIQFLDADDLLSKSKIEMQMNMLLSASNPQANIAHCCFGRFVGNNIRLSKKAEPHKSIRQHLKPVEWLISNCATVTGCWLAPRTLIEKAGMWNEALLRSQDEEFFTRLVARAGEVLYCNKARLYYREDTPYSISKNKSPSAAWSKLHAIELIEKQLLQLENSLRIKSAVANKYLECCYLNHITYPDLAALAEGHIERLGGADKLPGGFTLRMMSKLLGWKTTLKIRRMINDH